MPWDGTLLRVTEGVESMECGGVEEGSGTDGHRLVTEADGDTNVLQPLCIQQQESYFIYRMRADIIISTGTGWRGVLPRSKLNT